MASKPALQVVPQPASTQQVIAYMDKLKADIRAHMGLDNEEPVTVTSNPTGAGLIVGFLVRGHDEAQVAAMNLRGLPGYNVPYTMQSPSGMRKLIQGYIE